MYDMLQMIDEIPRMEIRPTGFLDPTIEVRGTEGQVADLLSEINARIEKGERTLVTVLTIKFADEVAQYLNKMGIKAHHLHSVMLDVHTSLGRLLYHQFLPID